MPENDGLREAVLCGEELLADPEQVARLFDGRATSLGRTPACTKRYGPSS